MSDGTTQDVESTEDAPQQEINPALAKQLLELKCTQLESTNTQLTQDLTESQTSLEAALKDLYKYRSPCQRCGHDAGEVLKADPEALKSYFAGVISGTNFSKEYIMGAGDNTLKLVFTNLSTDESEHVARLEYACGIAKKEGTDESLYSALDLARISVIAHLTTIQTETVVSILECETIVDVIALYKELLGSRPNAVTSYIHRCNTAYAHLNNLLFEASLDEDFWKGAGLS